MHKVCFCLKAVCSSSAVFLYDWVFALYNVFLHSFLVNAVFFTKGFSLQRIVVFTTDLFRYNGCSFLHMLFSSQQMFHFINYVCYRRCFSLQRNSYLQVFFSFQSVDLPYEGCYFFISVVFSNRQYSPPPPSPIPPHMF